MDTLFPFRLFVPMQSYLGELVELKKGRASDVVVGQIQRYMGCVIEELAESDQTVRGVIVAMEDDLRLRRALKATNNIDYYSYQVSFKLIKSQQ